MKRKLITAIGIAALLSVSAVGLAACGDDECTEHKWDNGTTTIEATCTTNGKKTVKCTVCGETEERDIPATGIHALSWKHEGGEHWQECDNCDYATEKAPHGDENWTETDRQDADCVNDGWIEYECICGDTKTETIDATGIHALSWKHEGGEHWQECDNCDHATEKAEHNWTETERQAADCVNDGWIEYECICGDTKTEPILATGEHNYATLVETKTPATCAAAGLGVYQCTGCEETEERAIPATGNHSFDKDGHNDTEHYKQCSVCETVDETSRENHDMNYVTDKEATLYETGTRHKECSGCDYREDDESYELDGFVTDYRDGVKGTAEGWTFGKADYNWSAPTEERLPGNTGNSESFLFTESAYNDNADEPAWTGNGIQVKPGWIDGNWVSMKYVVGENVMNATYTIALRYKYNPAPEHENLYTNINLRIAVLSQDNSCKYSEFISFNGKTGTNATRDIEGLNAGDTIYLFIEFVEEKERNEEDTEDINSSWSQGDFLCRLYEKKADEAQA
ncbi:MAG: hypothetical protein HDP28_04170 [Clostridia bacterium]|nr:hypothetical protein [Clostridia bacterium]